MRYKENWENTKKHFEAFWNKDYLERCSLAITVPTSASKPDVLCSVEDKYINPNSIDEIQNSIFSSNRYLYEALPAKYLNFGTAGQCEYFGCKPHYTDETVWFDPILNEPDISRVNADSGLLRFERHKQIAAELAQLSMGKYLISMPDNCGITDCLAEMRGTENLLVDMLENPEFVQEANKKIIEVWKATETEFFDILKQNNDGGSSHGWMQLWCPGRHVQIQCDYSVMISPDMFEEFVLPELTATAGVFEYTTYHLDGLEQLRHLDMILSVKEIDNIQWTPVDGQPKTSENIEALQKIQSAGKGLVLIPEPEEAEFLMENLSHKGLHLIINGVQTLDEARAIESLARKLAH